MAVGVTDMDPKLNQHLAKNAQKVNTVWVSEVRSTLLSGTAHGEPNTRTFGKASMRYPDDREILSQHARGVKIDV